MESSRWCSTAAQQDRILTESKYKTLFIIPIPLSPPPVIRSQIYSWLPSEVLPSCVVPSCWRPGPHCTALWMEVRVSEGSQFNPLDVWTQPGESWTWSFSSAAHTSALFMWNRGLAPNSGSLGVREENLKIDRNSYSVIPLISANEVTIPSLH